MARAVLPLHSKNPVADLQSANRIQAEPAVKRSTDQLTCCGKLGSVPAHPTISQAPCVEESCRECLRSRIRRVFSSELPVIPHKPVKIKSLIRVDRCRGYPLRGPQQSFTQIPQRGKHLIDARSNKRRSAPGVSQQNAGSGKLVGETTSNQQDISDGQGRRGSGCMVWLEWEKPHLKSQIASSFGGTSSHVLAKAPVSVQDSHRASAGIGYAHGFEYSCEIR